MKRGPTGWRSRQSEIGKVLPLKQKEARETQVSPAFCHSPSFGISAVHNLGTQSSQQHLCGAVLVINSEERGWLSRRSKGIGLPKSQTFEHG